MAREVTQRQRAAIALLEQMGLYGHPAASQFVGDILAALKTARQEALREGAKVAREFPWEQPSAHADPLRQARCRGNREASSDIAAALDRLASEGG